VAVNRLSHLRALTPIADPIHGRFFLNIFDRDIVDHAYFQRLHFILQNSANYVSFPSNKSTRFPHSIGVAHTAGRIFSKSLSNAPRVTLKRFLDDAADLIDSILRILTGGLKIHKESKSRFKDAHFATISGLSDFIHSPMLPNEREERIDTEMKFGKKQEFTAAFIIDTYWQAVRLYGFMHDIGHLPMSHAFEHGIESAPENIAVYSKDARVRKQFRNLIEHRKSHFTNEEDTARQGEVYRILSELFSNNRWTVNGDALDSVAFYKAIHEIRGLNFFIRFIRMHSSVPTITKNLGKVDADELTRYTELIHTLTLSIFFSAYFVKENRDVGDHHPQAFLYAIRQIIDGTVDADRLDYTLRDSHESGSHFGRFDLERIISNSILLENERKTLFNFGYYFRAVNGIEQFFEARYQLYKYVIYHRTSARTNQCISQLVSLLFVYAYLHRGSAIGVELSNHGYAQLDSIGNVVSLIPDDDAFIDRIDDHTFRSLLFKVKHICDKQLDNYDGQKNSADIRLLTDIRNLVRIVLLRDLDHVVTLFKTKRTDELVSKYIPEEVDRKTLDRFVQYIFKYNFKESSHILAGLLADLRNFPEEDRVMILYDVIEPKVFYQSNGRKIAGQHVGGLPFEEKVLVLDAGNGVSTITDVSSALRGMSSRFNSDYAVRVYAVGENIKSKPELVEKVEKVFLKAVPQLWEEFRNSPSQ
jgi:HD superfamily phosphohydrolase